MALNLGLVWPLGGFLVVFFNIPYQHYRLQIFLLLFETLGFHKHFDVKSKNASKPNFVQWIKLEKKASVMFMT